MQVHAYVVEEKYEDSEGRYFVDFKEFNGDRGWCLEVDPEEGGCDGTFDYLLEVSPSGRVLSASDLSPEPQEVQLADQQWVSFHEGDVWNPLPPLSGTLTGSVTKVHSRYQDPEADGWVFDVTFESKEGCEIRVPLRDRTGNLPTPTQIRIENGQYVPPREGLFEFEEGGTEVIQSEGDLLRVHSNSAIMPAKAIKWNFRFFFVEVGPSRIWVKVPEIAGGLRVTEQDAIERVSQVRGILTGDAEVTHVEGDDVLFHVKRENIDMYAYLVLVDSGLHPGDVLDLVWNKNGLQSVATEDHTWTFVEDEDLDEVGEDDEKATEFLQFLKDDLGVDPDALSVFLREQGVDMSRIAPPKADEDSEDDEMHDLKRALQKVGLLPPEPPSTDDEGAEGASPPVEVDESTLMGTVAQAAMGRVLEAIVGSPVASIASQSVRDQHVASAVESLVK